MEIYNSGILPKEVNSCPDGIHVLSPMFCLSYGVLGWPLKSLFYPMEGLRNASTEGTNETARYNSSIFYKMEIMVPFPKQRQRVLEFGTLLHSADPKRSYIF